MEEYQAIALLKNGNVSGLETLVHIYYFQAVRTSYLIVQDLSQAEDIVQTSFIHASEKIDQLSSDRFGPWFMKMVANASIKASQKQKRLVSLEGQGDEDGKFLAEWLIDRRPSVESMVETEELRQGIWRALVQLTVRQRAAVVLKYYLEMSEEEVSQVLHTPVSSIKWLLYAARQKLKNLLKFLKSSSNPLDGETILNLSEQQEKEYENERQEF